MIAVSKTFLTEMVTAVRLNNVGNGEVTVTLADVELLDGTTLHEPVMSVQPDGSVQTRPAGADGPYERAVVSGNLLVFRPAGDRAFAFPFAPKVPND